MESWFAGAPAGFTSAVAAMNGFDESKISEIILRSGGGGGGGNDGSTNPEERNAARALEYIFRGCRQSTSEEVATAIKNFTDLSDTWAAAISKEWTRRSSGKTSSAHHHLGSLDSLRWKVGVALESSSCSRLASPFVSLMLNIRDNEGVVKPFPLEMNMKEFSSFVQKVEEAQSVLDTL